MKSRVKWTLGIFLVILTIVIVFGYLFFFSGNERESSSSGVQLANPAASLSLEEAVAQFNESFVYYLLYSIGANKLHRVPLGSEDPKLEIVVSNDIYSAVVNNGKIKVSKVAIENGDIVIKTTKEEAVKMMNDRNYIEKSFKSGNSGIELVAGKTSLFAKGYLSIYEELTQSK